jgi:Tfp pilus assembly protein PilX
MENQQQHQRENERGMALITSLLATMMLLALGVAVLSSATTDTTTTKIQRVGEQAFFAADAGIGIARRAFTQALDEEIDKVRNGQTAYYRTGTSLSEVQLIPPPTANSAFYQRVYDRAKQLANSVTERNSRFNQLNGSAFTAEFEPLTGTVTPANSNNPVEVVVLRYAIKVTGTTGAGGSSSVHETGRITAQITFAGSGSGTGRNFKFSGFGAFFDNGDTTASSYLAAGTFSGPVHTNTHFAFNTSSNRNVTFRNVVSQVDNYIRYNSSSFSSGQIAIPNNSITGITISTEGYKKTSAVPLPANNFSQEFAVINSTGVTELKTDGTPVDPPQTVPTDSHGDPVDVFDSSGRVSTKVLAANLRNVINEAPNGNGNSIPAGVYVPSDGTAITGAGIYVEGDASDIQIYADTNGDQVYVIQQGQGSNITTTTIRTHYDSTSPTTTISSGSTTRTYTGVFMDRSDPLSPKPGTSLFVDGSINSLRGGKTSSTNRPAIASQTALTITAQRNITVTGDLKYTNPVSNTDGTPVSNINAITNVLGVFTNDGNLNLEPSSSYVAGPGLSMQMDAAVVTFNSKTNNDSGNIEGSITYTGSTPGTNDRWRLTGSRVQSKINSIGYNNRDIYYDVRFSGGRFGPPFFPGTSYELGAPATSALDIVAVDEPAATAMSWFRDSN